MAANNQFKPAIAYDVTRDQFLTAWQDFRAGNWHIYGQRTDGFGVLILANFAIRNTASQERNAAVAFSNVSGHYFVAWDITTNVLGRAYWP